jgi:uncharacterized protein (TIGR03032 family)
MVADASVPCQLEQTLSAGSPAGYSGPAIESRDIRYSYSESLPHLLRRLNSSLLVSTYSTGNLVVVSAPKGQLAVSFHTFERPMGVAVRPGWLAVGTRTQVWFLRSAPDIAGKIDPRGEFDACYLTRFAQFTGNIQSHELAWISSPLGPNERRVGTVAGDTELCIVNTLFSCLCTVHALYSFAPRWRPPFVSAVAPEDRCHLNGLAVADGKARYVTALAETDVAHGWRPVKVGGGCVIDVVSSQTVSRGLILPHSPRLVGDRLLVLHSGLGQLVAIDPADGRMETIAELPGYTRGLAVHGSLAFVGLSKIRASSLLSGVPIAAQPERLQCGFAIVDLRTGQAVAHFAFVSGIDEIFDIQILPGVSCPFISGPLADRGLGHPVWTLPPSG